MEALIKQLPDRWLSNSRMTHYQALLLNTEKVQFGPVVALNQATLLPLPEEVEPHDCLQILAETHGTRPDLMDQTLRNADHTWYTDGCSYVVNRERKAGAAINHRRRGNLGKRSTCRHFSTASRAHRPNTGP